MKLHFACLLLAVSLLPAIANAFLFGVTLTSAATGAAIAAANPATTAGIIGLGALGASLGAAGLAALQPRQPTTVIIRRPASSGRYYRRGKRQAGGNGNDLNQVFNSIFNSIEVEELGGCFERLTCDVTADPVTYQGNAFNILAGVEVVHGSPHFDLEPKAKEVVRRIYEARQVGLAAGNVQMCEDTYSQCQWTGEEMNKAVNLFKAKYGS